jgi:hypothetical protein
VPVLDADAVAASTVREGVARREKECDADQLPPAPPQHRGTAVGKGSKEAPGARLAAEAVAPEPVAECEALPVPERDTGSVGHFAEGDRLAEGVSVALPPRRGPEADCVGELVAEGDAARVSEALPLGEKEPEPVAQGVEERERASVAVERPLVHDGDGEGVQLTVKVAVSVKVVEAAREAVTVTVLVPGPSPQSMRPLRVGETEAVLVSERVAALEYVPSAPAVG